MQLYEFPFFNLYFILNISCNSKKIHWVAGLWLTISENREVGLTKIISITDMDAKDGSRGGQAVMFDKCNLTKVKKHFS